MALSSTLLDILACPEDKGPLWYIEVENMLYNPRLQRSYEIRDDIPVMLIDEGTSADADEHERIMGVIESSGIGPTFAAD